MKASVRQLGLPPEMVSLIPAGTPPVAAAVALLEASHIFHEDFYLAQQPPEIGQDEALEFHFLTKGWRCGLTPNFYVDPTFYLAQDGVDAALVNPLFHYLYVGEAADLRPSPHFDPVWYRKRYGLVGQSPLCHYLRHRHEHRFSPNSEFDTEFYFQTYADVRRCDDLFYHYALCGQREGRQARARRSAPGIKPVVERNTLEGDIQTIVNSEIFDANWYGRYAGQPTDDLRNLIRHYLTTSGEARANPNPLFDTAFYAAAHTDEIQGVDPFLHYIREGWRKGYDPHPLFSVTYYLQAHPDVHEVGCDPLWHYRNFGWQEGRQPCAEFDGAYYLESNADVASQNTEPLSHYLEYGAAEGRNPSPFFDTTWYADRFVNGAKTKALAHFRASGSDPDILVRDIQLSKSYAMSRSDLECWTRWFKDVAATQTATVEIVRVDNAPAPDADKASDKDGATSLETAILQSRAANDGGETKRRVFLVCAASDTLDARLASHLARDMTEAELGVFDFVANHDGAWMPVLLPGANAVHFEAVDATFSRFAIASGLLAQLDLDPKTATAHDVLKAAIAHLRTTRRLDAMSHTSVPILRARDISDALRAKRRDRAFEAHVGLQTKSSASDGPSVSVVICSKDRCRLLSQLLDALLAMPTSLVREIVVVTNSKDALAVRVHEHYAAKDRVEILQHTGPYNFSQQSNVGAARCTGDLLLFLNDDIVPIGTNWLDILRAPFARPEVGIAGPLLFYPDERVQHCGLFLGYHGIAGHTLRGARLPDEDYLFMASAPRNVSTVTGAALLTSRSLFEDLNGFDRQLGTYLQDVDYCLRVLNTDREIVYDPRSVLFHMESVSMRDTPEGAVFGDRRPVEHRHFVRKWGSSLSSDAFHNPSFDVEDEGMRTIVRSSR